MDTKVNKDYTEYITSFEWREKREETFKLKGRKCQRCPNNIHLHVHHATYARFKKENIETDLFVLCNSCHDLYHKQTTVISIPTTEAFIKDYFDKGSRLERLNYKRTQKKGKKSFIKNLSKVIRDNKKERRTNLDRMLRKGYITQKEYEEKLSLQ